MARPLSTLSLLWACACAPEARLPGGRILLVAPAPDGEWDDPDVRRGAPTFTTIQDAIDAASSGDAVEIPSGTYTEDIDLSDSITLTGAGRDQTILVGSVDITGATETTLQGLSVISTSWASGGSTASTGEGINVDGDGGIVHVLDVDVTGFKYGIYYIGAVDSTIGEVEVVSNDYGIYAEYNIDLLVRNALVRSSKETGIRSSYDTGTLVHNTLIGNGYGGSSALLGGIGLATGTAVTVVNNLATSNAVGISCVGCTWSATTNLIWGNSTDYANDASADPTDLSTDPELLDPSSGDYHLSSGSPAVDEGTDAGITGDIDGEARPQGSAVDIGFDEYAASEVELLISEVLANASTESTGELVELYNAGSASVELAGLVISDGDQQDTLVAFDGSSTTLSAGAYAVIVDPEYDGVYGIDASVPLLTTSDTHIGNGLTTSDPVTLYEEDGSTIIARFSHPSDPGEGLSLELVDLDTGDVAGNWRASACDGGSSPGAAHCFPESGDPADLILTEVMANAVSESEGEFVEIYNPTEGEIDLAGLVISDGGSSDVLVGFEGGSTLLPAYTHGLIIDPDFADTYVLPAGIVLLTTSDATIADGIANASDSIQLYASDGSTLIDSYTWVMDPGNGVSVEKVDYAAGDGASNWAAGDDSCAGGHSAGRLNGAAGGACGPLLITEVMANALDEDTGEYVEIYNAGADTIDLAGLCLTDGDQEDLLQGYEGGGTEIEPGAFALVIDAEYAGEYSLDASVPLLTTGDTTLGNALAVSDPVELLEADCVHRIDAFSYPSNPGNGVSAERLSFTTLDDASNWEGSTCAGGGSPAAVSCSSETASATSTYAGVLVITELMSNPLEESTGEFVEILNLGTDSIDLAGFMLYDGDATDTLQGFSDPTDTVLAAGGTAVILDADYTGVYSVPSTALLLTTDDAALASGLAVDDPIYLYEANGYSLIDSCTVALDAGNGVSVVRLDTGVGDTASNWTSSSCATGSSPGEQSCP